MTNASHPPSSRLDRRLRIAGWSAAAVLMLAPLVAMQFTDEVAWDGADFLFAGALIGGVGVLIELTFRLTGDWAYRTAVAVALAAVFLLVWSNAAVGIIGDGNNPANLMFGWVLAIGAVGAITARFRPLGMARALAVTALAQVLVAVIAVALGLEVPAPVIAVFTGLWLASAWLFRKAARQPAKAGVEQ